jgi:hypothetical protein
MQAPEEKKGISQGGMEIWPDIQTLPAGFAGERAKNCF